MLVKMTASLTTMDEEIGGVVRLKVDNEYDLPEYLAQSFINSGHAIAPVSPIVEDKPKRGRPKVDNKVVTEIEIKEKNSIIPESKED